MIRRQTEQVCSNSRNRPSIVLLADDPYGPIGLGVVSDSIDSSYKVLASWPPVELGLNVIVNKSHGQGVEVPIRRDISLVEPFAGSISIIYQSLRRNQC